MVDVFVTEIYIFQQVMMQPNPAVTLKIKLKINCKKDGNFWQYKQKKPPRNFLIFISVKVIFSPGFFVLTKSPECQNSFPSHPDLVPMLVLRPNNEINIWAVVGKKWRKRELGNALSTGVIVILVNILPVSCYFISIIRTYLPFNC